MNNSTPLISVIVPMYNSGETIERCLSGIMGQTFEDIEILVIDDGSTDTGPDISERLAESDKRVRLIRQRNTGPVGARKSGVESALGGWVCFVDSDDTLTKTALEKLYTLTDDRTDIVVSSGVGEKVTGEKRDNFTLLTPSQYCCNLLDFRFWPVWGKLYRRSLLDRWTMGLPRDFVVAEDFLTNLRVASNLSGYVAVTYETVYRYNRDNPKSLQHTFVPDYDYEVAVILAAEEAVSRLMSKAQDEYRYDGHALNDSFVKWRLRYLAGMIGMGYRVDSNQPWIRRLQNESRVTVLNPLEKLVLLSLRNDSAKIFFRLDKNVRSTVRRFIDKYFRSSLCQA